MLFAFDWGLLKWRDYTSQWLGFACFLVLLVVVGQVWFGSGKRLRTLGECLLFALFLLLTVVVGTLVGANLG